MVAMGNGRCGDGCDGEMEDVVMVVMGKWKMW